MFVVTFYLFKGGVGRTMALVNAAVALATSGKRVLAVDFDLEAPGLDTFDLPRSRTDTAGVVEYVTEYLHTGRAPSIGDFVYEVSGICAKPGGFWVMPSGRQVDSYSEEFNTIDWKGLYEEHDGYLMIEDLKAQWKQLVDPDYVLIDSRTGHTDVGGVCTRHLPDMVVAFFFPNEQNLRGLKKIVHDIRAEALGERKRQIDLLFVMSNVPDLDDEDGILKESLRRFQQEIGFSQLHQVHRYDSLSLLKQVVFTKDRPQSRLAKEYLALVEAIVQANPEDREGALNYLRQLQDQRLRYRDSSASDDVEHHLAQIEEKHANDGGILFQLGLLRLNENSSAEAEALFGRAVANGYRRPEAFLARAQTRSLLGDERGSKDDALQVLRTEGADPFQIGLAIRLLSLEEMSDLSSVASIQALPALARLRIARTLDSQAQLPTAREMLSRLVADTTLAADNRAEARRYLALVLIGLGSFEEAMSCISAQRPQPTESDVSRVFNYAMAEWGHSGTAPADLFARVIELARTATRKDANFFQCVAVANCVIGNSDDAERLVSMARSAVSAIGSEFSCWRYSRVSAEEFKNDLDSLQSMIDGEQTAPSFLRDTHPSAGGKHA